MPQYSAESFEELRLADYAKGMRACPDVVPASAGVAEASAAPAPPQQSAASVAASAVKTIVRSGYPGNTFKAQSIECVNNNGKSSTCTSHVCPVPPVPPPPALPQPRILGCINDRKTMTPTYLKRHRTFVAEHHCNARL